MTQLYDWETFEGGCDFNTAGSCNCIDTPHNERSFRIEIKYLTIVVQICFMWCNIQANSARMSSFKSVKNQFLSTLYVIIYTFLVMNTLLIMVLFLQSVQHFLLIQYFGFCIATNKGHKIYSSSVYGGNIHSS